MGRVWIWGPLSDMLQWWVPFTHSLFLHSFSRRVLGKALRPCGRRPQYSKGQTGRSHSRRTAPGGRGSEQESLLGRQARAQHPTMPHTPHSPWNPPLWALLPSAPAAAALSSPSTLRHAGPASTLPRACVRLTHPRDWSSAGCASGSLGHCPWPCMSMGRGLVTSPTPRRCCDRGDGHLRTTGARVGPRTRPSGAAGQAGSAQGAAAVCGVSGRGSAGEARDPRTRPPCLSP